MAFPATYNLNLYSGDTYEFVVVPRNSDGSDFDLTGYQSTMNIAASRGAVTKTEVQTVVDEVLNTVTCTILPGISAALSPASTYVYDVQISYGTPATSSKIFTILTGSISITEDVS